MVPQAPPVDSRPPSPAGRASGGLHRLRRRRLLGLILLAALLLATLAASFVLGARPTSLGEVLPALSTPSATDDISLVVWQLRFPRTLLALCVGAALGLAGALIQGHTRNPLADPGILGISAGASLAVVLGIFILGISAPAEYVWLALAGSAVAAVIVFGASSIGHGAANPMSLILAGAALSAFLTAMTTAITLADQSSLDKMRFWATGSVADRPLDVLWAVLPFLIVGAGIALASTPAMNALALGEDIATSLGIPVALTRLLGIFAITLLAGGGTAAAGPIGFVGLVVPHLARGITGPDHRWLLPYAGLLGAILVLAADIIGRVVARPGELQVGIVLALVGAPFFIFLVRRRKLVSL